MEQFDIEQFKRDPDTKEVEPGKYWNPRKKMLIKQNPPMGKPDIIDFKPTGVKAKSIIQKNAITMQLSKQEK